MSTRRYEQRLRAESAEQTRRRILDAMYDQLPELASVDALARHAGVARSTVYLIFGSRHDLLEALMRDVMKRGGLAELTEAVGHPDPIEHLRGALRANTRIYATEHAALRSLRHTEAFAAMEGRRLGGIEHLARRLGDAGLLEVTVPEAVDALWLLASFDAFDILFSGLGLGADQIADRLIHLAESGLLRGDAQ